MSQSNYREQALKILNDFVADVSLLDTNYDTEDTRSPYFYIEDDNSLASFEVELDDYVYNFETLTNDQVFHVILQSDESVEVSPEFEIQIRKAISNNFWLKYNKIVALKQVAVRSIIDLNRLAGTVLLDTQVFDLALASAREYYESSRCW